VRREGLRVLSVFWVAALSMVALWVATPAGAEVRRIEAVGAVPVYADQADSIAPRDAAIRKALREAVERVAEEFIAEIPLTGPAAGVPAPDEPALIDVEGAEALDFDAVLGKKMVHYTSRFRVVEDRGERPALFAEDPRVTSEYVVIVDVHVDVERVRKRLVQKGIIPEGTAVGEVHTLYLEVEGLTVYPAFQRLRELLLDDEIGVESVIVVDLRHGRTLLRLEAETGAVELLESLLTLAPPEMKLVPLHAAPNRAHIAIEWSGPVALPGDEAGS